MKVHLKGKREEKIKITSNTNKNLRETDEREHKNISGVVRDQEDSREIEKIERI